MSELSHEGARGDASTTPDAAAGDVPSQSDLPGMQGLGRNLANQGNVDPDAADPDADRGSAAGDVLTSAIDDAPTSGSDPMPDMSGTSGS